MVKGLSHVGLIVGDIERQMIFYRDVIGLKVLNERDVSAPQGGDHTGIPGVKRRLVFLGNEKGEELLELVYYNAPPSPAGKPLDRNQVNSIHLCFDIENLQGVYKNLQEGGVRFLTPPKVIDRPEGGPVCLCYGQDPEGNWLEFKEELGGVDNRASSGH